MPDRNGGFPRLSDGVAHGFRCSTSPRHALLAENLGKPSLGVIIKDLWYSPGRRRSATVIGRAGPARKNPAEGAAKQPLGFVAPLLARETVLGPSNRFHLAG